MIYNYVVKLSDNQKTNLYFSKHSERLFTLTPVHSDYETKNEKGEIISLNYNGCYEIKKDNTIIINNLKDKYKVHSIKRIGNSAFAKGANVAYHIYIQPCVTKSSTFIMPLLGQVKDYFRFSSEFINCYIGTEDNNDYGSYIYLLYRFSGSVEYTKFESEIIESHPLYNKTIEFDKHQTLYQFKIPEVFKEDYFRIIDGQYSKITPEAKERILSFCNADKNGVLYSILYRTEQRKKELEKSIDSDLPEDAELYSIFNKEEEILTNNFKIK